MTGKELERCVVLGFRNYCWKVAIYAAQKSSRYINAATFEKETKDKKENTVILFI